MPYRKIATAALLASAMSVGTSAATAQGALSQHAAITKDVLVSAHAEKRRSNRDRERAEEHRSGHASENVTRAEERRAARAAERAARATERQAAREAEQAARAAARAAREAAEDADDVEEPENEA